MKRATRNLDQLRRLTIAQSDDILELQRIKRMKEHVETRMANRFLEIEYLQDIVNAERSACVQGNVSVVTPI